MNYEEIEELLKSCQERLDDLNNYPQFTLKSDHKIEMEKEWLRERIKKLNEEKLLIERSSKKENKVKKL